VGALRAYRTLSGWVCDGVALWLVGRSARLQGLAARGDVYILGCDISVAKHDTDTSRGTTPTHLENFFNSNGATAAACHAQMPFLGAPVGAQKWRPCKTFVLAKFNAYEA